LELKFAAHDMLTILIDSGIDETDAKAIILDIILIQEAGTDERSKLIEARRERELARKKPKGFSTRAYDEDEDEDEEEEDEASEDADQKQRKKRRVNFSSFGGTGESLK